MIQFSKKTRQNIELIDSVLVSIGRPEMFLNSDFKIDKTWCWENSVNIIFSKLDCISIVITISDDGILFRLDRTSETIEWSFDNIIANQDDIVLFIQMLFKCSIHVKYCGKNYTCFSFVNENGDIVKTISVITGIYIKIGCSEKVYNAIY